MARFLFVCLFVCLLTASSSPLSSLLTLVTTSFTELVETAAPLWNPASYWSRATFTTAANSSLHNEERGCALTSVCDPHNALPKDRHCTEQRLGGAINSGYGKGNNHVAGHCGKCFPPLHALHSSIIQPSVSLGRSESSSHTPGWDITNKARFFSFLN